MTCEIPLMVRRNSVKNFDEESIDETVNILLSKRKLIKHMPSSCADIYIKFNQQICPICSVQCMTADQFFFHVVSQKHIKNLKPNLLKSDLDFWISIVTESINENNSNSTPSLLENTSDSIKTLKHTPFYTSFNEVILDSDQFNKTMLPVRAYSDRFSTSYIPTLLAEKAFSCYESLERCTFCDKEISNMRNFYSHTFCLGHFLIMKEKISVSLYDVIFWYQAFEINMNLLQNIYDACKSSPHLRRYIRNLGRKQGSPSYAEIVKKSINHPCFTLFKNIPVIRSEVILAKPVDVVAKPVDVVAKPVAVIAKPVNVIAKPVNVIAKPVNVIAKPVAVIAKPVDVVAKPVDVVAKPVAVIAKTVNEVVKPEETATASEIPAVTSKTNDLIPLLNKVNPSDSKDCFAYERVYKEISYIRYCLSLTDEVSLNTSTDFSKLRCHFCDVELLSKFHIVEHVVCDLHIVYLSSFLNPQTCDFMYWIKLLLDHRIKHY